MNAPHVPNSRESQMYADAIDAAVKQISREFPRPDLGALLGALAAVQAKYLAAIGDAKVRKVTRRQLEALTTDAIREYQAAPSNIRVHTDYRRAN